MGSKTKYYTELQVNHMFDELDNLWGIELARAVGKVKSMNPKDVFPAVINDSLFFYNEKVFDKMGVSANVYMSLERLSKDGIGYYIANNVDPTIGAVIDWYYEGVDASILQVTDTLNESYGNFPTCSDMLFQILNEHRFEIEYYAYKIDGKNYFIRKRIYDDKEVPDIQEVNGVYGVWMLEIDEDCNFVDENNPLHVQIPIDERAVLAVEYITENGTNKYIYLFEEDITKEATAEKTLIIPFYKNKAWVEPDKKVNFILNRFGLNAEDEDGDSLKKSMESSEDLKHAFISYTLDRNDEKFGHWVNFVYGSSDGHGNSTVANVSVQGDYDINYSMHVNPFDFSTSYKISVERETKNADDDYWYIIPVKLLQNQTLKNKFNAYKYMFNMIMYSEKKVKVKWYQTILFRIVFFVVAVFVGVALGFITVMQAVTMVVLQVISLVLQMIDPRLAAILGLAFALFTFNPGSLSNMLDIVNKMIRTYYAFASEAFSSQLESIQGQITDINEDIKDMKEQLADMWHQGMYVPLETQDYMMTTMYNGGEEWTEIMYNQSDMLELAMANMVNPNANLT